MDLDYSTMTAQQNEFWRALTAPFAAGAYKTRKGQANQIFTYLSARTIENRLDDVVGPGNWDLQALETSRGIICRLIIEAPDEVGKPKKVARSAGGGFSALQDEDSTFKSGFTSAFRGAAARFGIGRELYGNGMPGYCADLHNCGASGLPQSGPGSGAVPNTQGGGQQQQQYNNEGPGKPPFGKPGKAPYAWAKKAGEHFGTDVLGRMIDYAKKRKKPERTDQWDEAFLDECLTKTVEWIRALPGYANEYGAVAGAPSHAPSPDGTEELIKLRSAIVAAVTALILRQTGRTPTNGEVVACIGEIASAVPNAAGSRGEVLESLRACTDKVWLQGILRIANNRITEAARLEADSGQVADDDIPF